MKNLCIIPARSGSKGVPGKNKKELNGRPLIEYTFETAVRSSHIHRVILSTDCDAIASLATPYNVDVPFIRPTHLAQDNTPSIDVIKHALDFLRAQGELYDNVVLLQPTCPFRKHEFIDACIEKMMSENVDSLVSVRAVPHEYNPHWVFEDDGSGKLKIATGEEEIIPSRQLLPKAFIRDGSVYVFKTSNLSKYNSIYGKSIAYLESANIFHVNIDTVEDWNRAEELARLMTSSN